MRKIFTRALLVFIGSTTVQAKLKFKEKFTLLEYTSMGSATLIIETMLEHNGKKCKRSYVSGYVSSEETNSCNKKVEKVIHRIGNKLIRDQLNLTISPRFFFFFDCQVFKYDIIM